MLSRIDCSTKNCFVHVRCLREQGAPFRPNRHKIDLMTRMLKFVGVSLWCASSIPGVNPCFYDACLEELSTIQQESINRNTYLEMVSRLCEGRTEPSVAKRLSQRSKAIFNMCACADERPCVINPTIPVRTVEDRHKLCETSEILLQDTDIPSDKSCRQNTRDMV
jgi:hypothetical protein